MNFQFKQIRHIRNMLPAIMLSLIYANSAAAGTEVFSFNNDVYNTPGDPLAGIAPWLTLQVSDTATAGSLQFTLTTSANFVGTQQVTNIFLNIPTAEAAALTGITVSSATNAAAAPQAFGSGSSYSSTQSIVPIPASAAEAGKFDIDLKFTSSQIIGASFSETFNLNFHGATPTAADLLTTSLPNTGGSSFYAAATISNAGGTGGSGQSSIVTAVPLPAAVWLFGSAVVGFLGFNRRKIA